MLRGKSWGCNVLFEPSPSFCGHSQGHCYEKLGTACVHGSSNVGMLSKKFSHINRFHITEESVNVSSCVLRFEFPGNQ